MDDERPAVKGILEFDLSEHEGRMRHLAAVKADDMAVLFWHLIHNSVSEFDTLIEKQGHEYTPGELLSQFIYDKLQEHGIIIDDLTE